MLRAPRTLFSVTCLPRVVVLGVTGGIASGKTMRCCHLLRLAQARARQPINSFAAAYVNADQLGHDVYAPGRPCYYDIIDVFGKGVLRERNDTSGAFPRGDAVAAVSSSSSSTYTEPCIDRKKLAEIVFREPRSKELRQLSDICWPYIHEAIEQAIDDATNAALSNKKDVLLIILEAALLIESSSLSFCDDIWITTCEKSLAVLRLMERHRETEAQAIARVEAHPTYEEKLQFLMDIKFKGAITTFDTTDVMEGEGLRSITVAFDAYWRRKLEPLQNNPTAETSSWDAN